MTQTGTGIARAMKVFRRRVADNWTESTDGLIWWPESAGFVPPPFTEPPDQPATILRVDMNRSFEDPDGFGGGTSSGQGSISLCLGVQPRPGMLDRQDASETKIRAIGDPSENDDAEDVWTLSGIEVNHGIQPRGVPENIATEFAWTQYVIPFRICEGYI